MVASSLRMRFGVASDAEPITTYHYACWVQAFEPIVSPQVMEYIHNRPIEPRIASWHKRLRPNSDSTTVVAVDDLDRPIGHTMVQGNELVHLFVDPEHHGKGIGRELLAVGERLIRQAGHRHAELHTIVGNAAAIALYESCGWIVTTDTLTEDLPNGSSYVEHVLLKDFDDQSHVEANRETWDEKAPSWIDRGRRSWAADAHWGEMAIPEAQLHALPDLAGRDVLELGCGTGYVSAWCLRAGARSAVGIDNSIQQLSSAKALRSEFDVELPLLRSNAENLPIADGSFDVAINEYGAGHWCDPYLWVPEAARILRPGGSLMFLAWSTLMAMCAPPFEHQFTSTNLLHGQRNLHDRPFPDTDGVQFALGHGKWIELLTENGFVVERLIELYAPDSPDAPERYSYYDASWARQWPPEEIWCATKRAS